MAASEEVRGDPPILEAAAGACADLRGRLQTGGTDVTRETEAAISALPGWETRSALESLLWAWRDDIEGFAKYLDSLGNALSGCARDYRHADHANAALFDIRGW